MLFSTLNVLLSFELFEFVVSICIYSNIQWTHQCHIANLQTFVLHWRQNFQKLQYCKNRMGHIEYYKENWGESHQSNDHLVALEINIIATGLAYHACSFIIILVRAVHHLIVGEEISIRQLLLFNFVSTLSIFRKSFNKICKEATSSTICLFLLINVISCVILFNAAFIIDDFACRNLYLELIKTLRTF